MESAPTDSNFPWPNWCEASGGWCAFRMLRNEIASPICRADGWGVEVVGRPQEPRREGERGGEGSPGWEMCPADEVKRTILRAAKNGGSAKAEETEDGGNHSNPPLRLLPSSILFQANAAGGNIGVQIIQGWGKSLPKGGVEGYQVAEGVDGLGDEAGGVAQEAGDGLHDDQQEVGPDPHHRHPLARVQVPPALLLYGSESGGGVMCEHVRG